MNSFNVIFLFLLNVSITWGQDVRKHNTNNLHNINDVLKKNINCEYALAKTHILHTNKIHR